MKKIQYSITKDHCKTMIEGLVCDCCGKKVVPIRTVDNADRPTFWGGCKKCNRFSWGVPPRIFKIAKEMVDSYMFIAYSHLGVKHNHPESEWPEWYRSQYSGTTTIVRNVLKISNKIKDDTTPIKTGN